MTKIHTFGLAALLAWSGSALAQDKPAVSMPAAQAPAMQSAASPVAKKAVTQKRQQTAKRKQASPCTPLDDPWDNMCQIKKNAQFACQDLPAAQPDKANRKSAKSKKSAAPAVPAAPAENRRQQCIDNYMRNV